MTDEEIDRLYVQLTGKTRWEEARASSTMIGLGVFLLLFWGVVGAACVVLFSAD
ncbi:MAG TPA: hypothetical protein VFI02_20670 [Armatimonadota bacterium]|nr:hypothetical protein [Armatimonadota bacterium]